jgi:flavin reductase (DIM6/NTAB) family NADH-FMN oxidoreductase RutF
MPGEIEFDLDALEHRQRYLLLTSIVVPRPIAWISTEDASGARNLAPYSYFNACSITPPIVHFTSIGESDSIANARATGEFVVNIVSHELAPEMRVTAAAFEAGESPAGARSARVTPPRVARAKVALECRLRDILEIGEGTMAFGDVLHVHIDHSIWRDGRVDPTLLAPVARLGGMHYATVREVYRMDDNGRQDRP